MSWLRTDDAFSSHPKFEGWTAADKWAFLELMHYCARYRTGGRIPNDLGLLPRSVTARLLNRAEASGWLDHRSDALWLHDWDIYNPKDATGAARAKRYRDRDAERDVDRDAGRDAGVTDSVTTSVTEALPRARARAGSSPVPSRTGVHSKAVAGRRAREASTATADETTWEDKSDPVVRLLLTLTDRDDGTEGVLRSFIGRVPEHAFDFTRDEVERSNGGAGLAVTILQRIEREGTFVTPAEPAAEDHAKLDVEDARRQRHDQLVTNLTIAVAQWDEMDSLLFHELLDGMETQYEVKLTDQDRDRLWNVTYDVHHPPKEATE